MPIFEFACPECGIFEELVSGSPETMNCPACGTESAKIPSACSAVCRRSVSEVAPDIHQWNETEGKRRERLPDNHPDKLVPVGRGSDLANGVLGAPAKPQEKFDVGQTYQRWNNMGRPDARKVRELAKSGKLK